MKRIIEWLIKPYRVFKQRRKYYKQLSDRPVTILIRLDMFYNSFFPRLYLWEYERMCLKRDRYYASKETQETILSKR